MILESHSLQKRFKFKNIFNSILAETFDNLLLKYVKKLF
jgi:hypothetical protein